MSPTSSPGRLRSTRGGLPSIGLSNSPSESISRPSCSPRTTGPRRMIPFRPGIAARQRGVRGRTVRRRPACGARLSSMRTFEVADRPPRADLFRYDPAISPAEVRAINEKLRKASRPKVAAAWSKACGGSSRLRTERRATVCGRRPAHLARPRRWLDCERPGLAGGWHPVGTLLERGYEGTAGSRRHLLLLERRAASARDCPADRGDRRVQAGDRRPRRRVLDDTVGS